MTALTRFALAHKRLVAVFWIVVALVGLVGAGRASQALETSFSMPESEAFATNQEIERLFGSGGTERVGVACERALLACLQSITGLELREQAARLQQEPAERLERRHARRPILDRRDQAFAEGPPHGTPSGDSRNEGHESESTTEGFALDSANGPWSRTTHARWPPTRRGPAGAGPRCSSRALFAGRCHTTLKLSIMPASSCSSLWQCKR